MLALLPYQIQLSIYQYAMRWDQAILMASPSPRVYPFRRPQVLRRNDLSLLAVSRNTREMALPIFWGDNSFYFDVADYEGSRPRYVPVSTRCVAS